MVGNRRGQKNTTHFQTEFFSHAFCGRGQYAYSEHRCRPNQSPEPSVIAFDREIGNFDRSIRVTIAVGHKGLLSVYSKRVAEFALATAILALSAAVCMAAKEAAARLEDGQVR